MAVAGPQHWLTSQLRLPVLKWGIIEGVHKVNGGGPNGSWGWICAIANMHQLGFLPAYSETKFGCFFLEDSEAGFEVCNFVTEQGGVISILQVSQMVVTQSDFCDPLADMSH